MASTRAHAGWFTRCCVELPSTNPTNTVQKQYKNRPTTAQKPTKNRYNNRLQKHKQAKTPTRYAAIRDFS
jgi:hypothetical protein